MTDPSYPRCRQRILARLWRPLIWGTLGSALLLTGCGYKGPLTLPPKDLAYHISSIPYHS